jgi:hypothetical protein
MENANFIISTQYDGKPRKLYRHLCLICDVEFWVPRHKKKLCCSLTCRGKAKTKNQTVILICTRCGIEFHKRQSSLVNSKHQKFFCSRKCKDLAQRLDGDCPEIRPSHYGTGTGIHGYRLIMAKEIKDGCIDCHETQSYFLEVHHIDGNRNNNAKSNLEVVCVKDHRRRHLQFIKDTWNFSSHVLTPRENLAEV